MPGVSTHMEDEGKGRWLASKPQQQASRGTISLDLH